MLLPPRWGEDVAPPPTPFLTSPETSPTHQIPVEQLMPPPPPQLRHPPGWEEGRVPSRHRCGHPHHRRTSKHQQQKRVARNGHVYQNHRNPAGEFRLHHPQSAEFPAPPAAFPNQFEFYLHRNDSASSLAGAVGSADEVVTYAYRFTGDNGVDREEIPFGRHRRDPRDYGGAEVLAGYSNRLNGHHPRRLNRRHTRHNSRQSLAPPPNSQSTSPVTTGSSPEAAAAASSSAHALTTSPASPFEGDFEEPRPLSILRSSSAISSMKKSVQWVSDGKRRPEDISRDRRVVKNQVDHNESTTSNNASGSYLAITISSFRRTTTALAGPCCHKSGGKRRGQLSPHFAEKPARKAVSCKRPSCIYQDQISRLA